MGVIGLWWSWLTIMPMHNMNKEKIVNLIKKQTLQYAINKGYPVIGSKKKLEKTKDNNGFPIGAFVSLEGNPTARYTRLVHPCPTRVRGYNHRGSTWGMSREINLYEPVPQDEIESRLSTEQVNSFEADVVFIKLI